MTSTIKTPSIETPAFTIGEGTIAQEAAGSRTVFRFSAPAKRHVEGGFEASGVGAVLLDRDGRFVARRNAEWSRTVLANRASWVHELPQEQLQWASRLVYQIELRIDTRRKLTAGEVPALPAEADGNDYWRWLSIDPRVVEDRLAAFDVALWARTGEVAITHSCTPKITTDAFRCEYELDLLDAERQVVATRHFSSSLVCGRASYEDNAISMERRVMHTLKFFELRVRCETRAVYDLAVELP